MQLPAEGYGFLHSAIPEDFDDGHALTLFLILIRSLKKAEVVQNNNCQPDLCLQEQWRPVSKCRPWRWWERNSVKSIWVRTARLCAPSYAAHLRTGFTHLSNKNIQCTLFGNINIVQLKQEFWRTQQHIKWFLPFCQPRMVTTILRRESWVGHNSSLWARCAQSNHLPNEANACPIRLCKVHQVCTHFILPNLLHLSTTWFSHRSVKTRHETPNQRHCTRLS